MNGTDSAPRFSKQASLAGALASTVGRATVGTVGLAAKLLEKAVDAGVRYPYLIGLPVAAYAASVAAGYKPSAADFIAWSNPSDNTRYRAPGVFSNHIKKDTRYGF